MTPNPGDEEPPPPRTRQLAFPLPYTPKLGTIRVAPARTDRLWVSVGGDRETVVALLDADGRPLPDWPIVRPFAEDCHPLAASDGSVRLICYYSEEDPETCVDVCDEERVFAFTGIRATSWPASRSRFRTESASALIVTRPDHRQTCGRPRLSTTRSSAEFGEFGARYARTVGPMER